MSAIRFRAPCWPWLTTAAKPKWKRSVHNLLPVRTYQDHAAPKRKLLNEAQGKLMEGPEIRPRFIQRGRSRQDPQQLDLSMKLVLGGGQYLPGEPDGLIAHRGLLLQDRVHGEPS